MVINTTISYTFSLEGRLTAVNTISPIWPHAPLPFIHRIMWMRWYKDCKGPWNIPSIFEILNKKIQHCTSWHHTPLPHLTTPFLHAHDWVSDWRNHTQCSFETSNCAINDMEIISINLIGNYRRVSRDLTSCISALTCTWLADLPKRKSEKLKTPWCKFYAQYSWPVPLRKSQSEMDIDVRHNFGREHHDPRH